MSRPHGSKSRKTILREAEIEGKLRAPNTIYDTLHIIEVAASWFFERAVKPRKGRKPIEVDEDYRSTAQLAALAVPFKHARLAATRILGDPNSPVDIKDNATADELRAEIMKRIEILVSAGLIDLKALPMLDGGIANQPFCDVDQSGINGE
jgi:hypothetical protein